MQTLDTYRHLCPDSDEQTREAVEEVLRPDLSKGSEDSVRTASTQSP
jgi:hypothetical protein